MNELPSVIHRLSEPSGIVKTWFNLFILNMNRRKSRELRTLYMGLQSLCQVLGGVENDIVLSLPKFPSAAFT